MQVFTRVSLVLKLELMRIPESSGWVPISIATVKGATQASTPLDKIGPSMSVASTRSGIHYVQSSEPAHFSATSQMMLCKVLAQPLVEGAHSTHFLLIVCPTPYLRTEGQNTPDLSTVLASCLAFLSKQVLLMQRKVVQSNENAMSRQLQVFLLGIARLSAPL